MTTCHRSFVAVFSPSHPRFQYGFVLQGRDPTLRQISMMLSSMNVWSRSHARAGAKLLSDEVHRHVCSPTPTFVTPDVVANAQLQKESVKNAQIFYFVNLSRHHVLDLIMQSPDQDAEQPI